MPTQRRGTTPPLMSVRLRSLVLPLLLSLGCTSSKPDSADSPEAKDEESKTPDAAAGGAAADEPAAKDEPAAEDEPAAGNTKRIEIASAEPPEIVVIEAGTDPQVLRLNPVVGTSETLKMIMKINMQMGPAMPPVDMPPMVTSISGVANEVTEDSIKATMKFESMTVEPEPDTPKMLVEQLEKTFEGFKSFKSVVEIDKRGALLGGYTDMPQGLPAPMQQSMNQMQESFGKLQVPLPEEAVGVGGKWNAISQVDQGGLRLKQTATYELLGREGDRVQLKVNIEQKLVDNTFKPPGMPGVEGTIERYSGGGSGTLELKLDKLTPTKSAMTMNVDMKIKMSVMGQEQVQEIAMKLGIDLERTD